MWQLEVIILRAYLKVAERVDVKSSQHKKKNFCDNMVINFKKTYDGHTLYKY